MVYRHTTPLFKGYGEEVQERKRRDCRAVALKSLVDSIVGGNSYVLTARDRVATVSDSRGRKLYDEYQFEVEIEEVEGVGRGPL